MKASAQTPIKIHASRNPVPSVVASEVVEGRRRLWRNPFGAMPNLGDEVWLKAAYRGGCQACHLKQQQYAMQDATVIAFRQSEAIDESSPDRSRT